MDEGRNAVGLCAASIPASSAASWHSTTALPSEEQGLLPPAESQQLDCRCVFTCSGMKGCSQEPGVIQQHLRPTQTQCEGQFQEVIEQHLRPVQVLKAQVTWEHLKPAPAWHSTPEGATS